MLEVTAVNKNTGDGTNVALYMGFMSHKHLYLRLIQKKDPTNKSFPKYLRVKRSYTILTERHRYFSDLNGITHIRTFEYPEGSTFSEDLRIFRIYKGTPEAELIEEVIPGELLPAVN